MKWHMREHRVFLWNNCSFYGERMLKFVWGWQEIKGKIRMILVKGADPFSACALLRFLVSALYFFSFFFLPLKRSVIDEIIILLDFESTTFWCRFVFSCRMHHDFLFSFKIMNSLSFKISLFYIDIHEKDFIGNTWKWLAIYSHSQF